jgi:hypothetical protein
MRWQSYPSQIGYPLWRVPLDTESFLASRAQSTLRTAIGLTDILDEFDQLLALRPRGR